MHGLVLHHPYVTPRFEQDLLAQVAKRPGFVVAPAILEALDAGVLASPGGAVALEAFDAVIVFVAFRRLNAAKTLDWRGYRGLRVLMDHDVIQNYSAIFDRTLQGAWPPAFRRHGFDSVVASGRAVTARLEADGVPADWVPKGFEPARFAPRAGRRAGVASYGSAYACRQVAERALKEAGVKVTRLPPTPYPKLGAKLSGFLACMAVSSELCAADEGAPARDAPMTPGLEPMAKFFESAGAGVCPVADAMEDLDALGFRDGESVLTFRTHGELVDKLAAALADPKRLRALGEAAAARAHAGHTWAHRAAALQAAIERRAALRGSPAT
ncbi:MAG: glycosyltransferase [Hyphomonadaceae bacterium]|nr:glycosyltransferase [Hyphomonadaceae bacterium]